MVRHEASRRSGKLRVTFNMPPSVWADRVWLIVDFDGRSHCTIEMEQDPREQGWQAQLDLDPGSCLRYGYLIDGTQWTVDHDGEWETNADGLAWSLVELPSTIAIPWINTPAPGAQTDTDTGDISAKGGYAHRFAA